MSFSSFSFCCFIATAQSGVLKTNSTVGFSSLKTGAIPRRYLEAIFGSSKFQPEDDDDDDFDFTLPDVDISCNDDVGDIGGFDTGRFDDRESGKET